MRTSSAANLGEGKDSEARQRKAIEGYAKSAGMAIIEWFYDAAVSGADPIEARPGFAAALFGLGGRLDAWDEINLSGRRGQIDLHLTEFE